MQILAFLVILSVLVLIHEAGHFVAARFFKIKVEEFGLGIPPLAKKLFKWKGTLFSLNWLPIGGFVRLKGEDYVEGKLMEKDAFWSKPVWQRASVLFSGVVMNFLLGVVLFGVIYSVLGVPTEMDRVSIVEVVEQSPAEKAGMEEGDVVEWVRFGDKETAFTKTGELVNYIGEHKGEELTFLLLRGEEEIEMTVVPRVDPPEGEGSLGVALSNVELKKFVWWQMPFRGVVVGMREAASWGKMIAKGVGSLLIGIFKGEGVPDDIAGPVGIYQISSQVTQMGWLATFHFVAVFSVNLAVLNILPIPALDGGRMLFLLVEMVIGKKRKNKIEGWVHGVGMIFLLGLLVLVTIRDILKLFI